MNARLTPFGKPRASEEHVDSPESAIPVRAWAAVAAIDDEGHRHRGPGDAALTLVAISVHEACPTEIEHRIELMRDVARQISIATPSLWVYPAGYFGFNAAAYSDGRQVDRPRDIDTNDITAKLQEIMDAHPRDASVAFGVDVNDLQQQAWLVRRGSPGSATAPVLHTIRRGDTPLTERCFKLGPRGLKAAFFVCAEIADYEERLADCRVIADLAHVRVPGTVWCDHAGARMLHQRVLTTASQHGAALMTHHHAGCHAKAGHQHFRHQSNWIVFRGDGTEWVDPGSVIPIR